MAGIICPLVDIGLTNLPESGGAMAPPASPAPTDLVLLLSRDPIVKKHPRESRGTFTLRSNKSFYLRIIFDIFQLLELEL